MLIESCNLQAASRGLTTQKNKTGRNVLLPDILQRSVHSDRTIILKRAV